MSQLLRVSVHRCDRRGKIRFPSKELPGVGVEWRIGAEEEGAVDARETLRDLWRQPFQIACHGFEDDAEGLQCAAELMNRELLDLVDALHLVLPSRPQSRIELLAGEREEAGPESLHDRHAGSGEVKQEALLVVRTLCRPSAAVFLDHLVESGGGFAHLLGKKRVPLPFVGKSGNDEGGSEHNGEVSTWASAKPMASRTGFGA
ncbi:MAG: hypothetical protein HYY06_23655 [Deltaproteobacteria bacterium]|nr:hypothetical protein [Deltaproteobacteria bacterium]